MAGLKDKQDPNGTTSAKSSSSGLGLGSTSKPSTPTQMAETNSSSHNARQMSSSSTNSSSEDLMSRMTPVLYQMEEPKNHIYIDTNLGSHEGAVLTAPYLFYLSQMLQPRSFFQAQTILPQNNILFAHHTSSMYIYIHQFEYF